MDNNYSQKYRGYVIRRNQTGYYIEYRGIHVARLDGPYAACIAFIDRRLAFCDERAVAL